MHDATAIAIAWPETMCKQPGSWYDGILKFLGFSQGIYFKVGHAAVVLIEHQSRNAHYFDFGRYHSPFQHGRVRSAITDHDLKINCKPEIENNRIVNMKDILSELKSNKSCHGDGILKASSCSINFKTSMEKCEQLQNDSPLLYGPFTLKGTNCSRFVSTVILEGRPSLKYKLRLLFPWTFTPTPIGNVNALSNSISIQ